MVEVRRIVRLAFGNPRRFAGPCPARASPTNWPLANLLNGSALPRVRSSADEQKKRAVAGVATVRMFYMVEVRRIELRSKAVPWQVSPSSVADWVSGIARTVTHA